MPHDTAPRRSPGHPHFPIVGALVGLMVFLASALLPSLLHGGVVGLQVANRVFGVPQSHVFGVHAFIVAGITAAAFAMASLFAAMGAVAGASIGALTRSGGRR